MEFEAIIFDMDGVIVDSEPRHERAFLEIFQEMGFADNHGIDFSAYYGRSDRALWADFVQLHQPSQSLEELCDWKQRRFLEIIEADQPIFDGIPELLLSLSSRYKLALASGSFHPVIDAILRMKNLRQFFQAVVSVQDVPRGKPWPDVFLEAARRLEVPPARCCVIEDADAGVEAALAAGMKVIAVTTSLPRERLARANWVISSCAEIPSLLGLASPVERSIC